MRLLHESDSYEHSAFITLTYDSVNLPVRAGTFIGHLLKDDLQRYFKRLRVGLLRADLDSSIRYYACGEYGEKYDRPHYHAIVFNLSSVGFEIARESWTHGLVHIGGVTADSIRYVAGYVAKKLGDYSFDRSRPSPFQLSSQGLGLDWLKGNQVRVLYDAALSFKGKKFSLPRYYRDKASQLFFHGAVDGMLERLHVSKSLSFTDSILEFLPQFGGKSFDELTDAERGVVCVEFARRGAIVNGDLASNQHIKLLGQLAKKRLDL
jgi:hypothetical protein